MTFIPYDTQTTTAGEAEDQVSNNGFFPALSLSAFRASMRVDDTVSTARAMHQLSLAMYSVNTELADWQQQYINDGILSLDEISTSEYETKRLTALYNDAVYNETKARILENYQDIDTTKSGEQNAERLAPRIHDYYKKCRAAIAMLTDKPTTRAELI